MVLKMKNKCHKCNESDKNKLIEFRECLTWGRVLYVCNECKHDDDSAYNATIGKQNES